MACLAGTSYFVRQVRADAIFDIINTHKVEYLAGAPILMNTLLSSPLKKRFNHAVKFMTAGAPPPPSVIKKFAEELGVFVQTAVLFDNNKKLFDSIIDFFLINIFSMASQR